ncbi:conjugal transfer protein TrbL [Brevibacterium casei]|uniref:Conjugal transfer protein TrbL n=2 Tax=Brevibacterium casei TaxID=33889 RepID=A0A2H1K2D2_9MICO|nr:conjugal transfer protein TrbL [Brevibacterium casei]MCT1549037.1 conjugal transfer protein TrbL [Brevibacterium casei]MCT1558896.1 conjugal transfer protein TrbL [Brevibacterium casei]MCT2207247.1 conjugal transfer protein TrbL [Brevibacterium casei]QPR38100.1 conjugal transfer protein TrbL [Brevibacterium casei]QPR45389.1 conjugal transfer protein TrbL [Brevibacterium casei]
MGVCDVPIISSVCDVAGEAAATLVSAPFDWLASAMGAAAGWLFEAVWSVFDTTTLVDVTRDEYIAVYNILFGIAIFIMLIFFCLQLITGLIRRDPTALSRAALGLAKSVLGSFVVITLTALLLEIVDQLSVGIIHAAGETTESMGDKITLLVAGLAAINIAAPGVGAIITIFLAGLAISAAAIVWLSLLVRKALLLVAIVLAPLAFSGASWDATKGWISKWAMFVIALIVSKLVLVVMFLVAITQVSAPIDGDLASVADPIAGIVLMAMAAFAPYMTYKFLNFVGFDMYHAIGSEQDAKSALNRPMPTPTKPQGGNDPKKVLDEGGGKSGGGGGDGGGGKKPPEPKNPKPQASSGAAGSAGAGGGKAAASSGAGAGAGASGGAGAGAGAGAAAAGPAAAAVVAAKVAKDSAAAGPKAGKALGNQGEAAADSAGQAGSTPPSAQAPPPSTPAPKTPSPGPSASEVRPPTQPPPPAPKPTGKE